MPATVDILREPSRLFRAPVARGIAPDAQIDPEGGAYGAEGSPRDPGSIPRAVPTGLV